MPNRSSNARLGDYKLFAEEKGAIDPTTKESWRSRVLAPNGQPIVDLVLMEGPWSQAKAQARAELVAREDARRKGKPLPPDVLPEWTES